ncbi:MAG: LacI family transcriptional regulator [Clostridia bacterium]|nr:LacI family transcriptional regulator [Clostridia bacterium]
MSSEEPSPEKGEGLTDGKQTVKKKQMEKITIKDVARLAGVSVATVSYVINGIHEDRYTPDTKRKILQIVNLYNFRPSRLAQSFALQKSSNVIILTGKHESIIQKAESYDFLRLLGKTFERLGYNLNLRTYLENTRIDTADAIICVGMEEEKFRRLAQENFVPLISVDGKINDELFFQVYQDFGYVLQEGEKKFGKGNFSVVLADMYNKTLRDEISALSENIVFITDNDVSKLPKGNIVTVHSSLKSFSELKNQNMLFVPSNTQERVDAILDCFKKATERVQGTIHTVKVK